MKRPKPRRLRPGTVVVTRVGMRGTVIRHVEGADGGSYHVLWENGFDGYVAPCNITVAPRDGAFIIAKRGFLK